MLKQRIENGVIDNVVYTKIYALIFDVLIGRV